MTGEKRGDLEKNLRQEMKHFGADIEEQGVKVRYKPPHSEGTRRNTWNGQSWALVTFKTAAAAKEAIKAGIRVPMTSDMDRNLGMLPIQIVNREHANRDRYSTRRVQAEVQKRLLQAVSSLCLLRKCLPDDTHMWPCALVAWCPLGLRVWPCVQGADSLDREWRYADSPKGGETANPLAADATADDHLHLQIDLTGDGTAETMAYDTSGDGRIDALDTTGDGEIDTVLRNYTVR